MDNLIKAIEALKNKPVIIGLPMIFFSDQKAQDYFLWETTTVAGRAFAEKIRVKEDRKSNRKYYKKRTRLHKAKKLGAARRKSDG